MTGLHFQRYNRVAIAFHWTIALLILANWPIGYFGEWIELHLGRNLVPLHKSLGLSVLALSLLRLAWRLAHPAPPLPSMLAAWRARSARATHVILYALMIAVPLTGWMRTSANAHPLTWFGLGPLPKFLIERGSPEAQIVARGHELLAWAMLILLVVHVTAALHHHFRLRDPVLLRMMPQRAA